MMSKMEFDCKLAHFDEIKKVSGFSSIKELYERISQVFSVPSNQILFCTLNSHNPRDMDSLLGNYLSLGDMIIVHMSGRNKDLSIEKTQEYLGLTITDNGFGRAFVKKVKSKEGFIEKIIKPGDHIAAIDCKSTIGMRHYEVARSIREVPQHTNFTLHLIEPKCIKDHDGRVQDQTDIKALDDLKNDSKSIPLLKFTDSQSMEHMDNNLSLCEDLMNSSLPIDQLLSTRTESKNVDFATLEGHRLDGHDTYRTTIDKINSILESFLGINDNVLAIQIYRLARENGDSFEKFTSAIKSSELGVFNFGREIETYLWNCATGSAA